MSSRLGMDSAVVRGCADQMDALADSLASVVTSVNGAVGRVSTVWLGPDAHELVQQWQYRDRDAVAVLATHVHELARVARTSAAAQDATSSAAGVSAGAEDAGVGFPLRGFLDSIDDHLGQINSDLDMPGNINYISQFLTKADVLPDIFEHISEIGAAVSVLGVVGSGVSIARHTVDAGVDFGSGRYVDGGVDVTEDVASGLKADPDTYAYGFVLSEWTDVFEVARQIDWSQPIPVPTPANLYHDYLPAFGEALSELPSHVVSWF